MRITILGLGAIGAHLAVRLTQAGHDVSAVARGATLAAVTRDGVTLEVAGLRSSVAIEVSDDPRALPEAELVFVTVKATDPSGLARTLAPFARANTNVVFAQNGIPWWYGAFEQLRQADLSFLDPAGELRRAVPIERVLGAVVNSPNEVLAPGVSVHRVPGPNVIAIGELTERSSARVEAVRELLRGAGFDSPAIASLRQALWRKQMINASASLLCLVHGSRCTILRTDERVRADYLALAHEVIAIAAALGVDTRDFDPLAFAANPPDHMPSIRRDFELGRALELDAIGFATQSLARSVSVPTPRLDALLVQALDMLRERGPAR